MKTALLLTGEPGVGKTTAIKEALRRAGLSAGGFYTEEIREKGIRQGFRLVTLEGETAILAHVSFPGPYRVSKYGVDIAALEKIGLEALRQAASGCQVVVIDEIGKMELYSAAFREEVGALVQGGQRVLGTILQGPHPWADGLKAHPAVELLTLTRTNRSKTVEIIVDWLNSAPRRE